MPETPTVEDLVVTLNQHHRVVRESSDDGEQVRRVYDLVRDRFEEMIRSESNPKTQEEMDELCEKLTRWMKEGFRQEVGEAIAEEIDQKVLRSVRKRVGDARTSARNQIANRAGWERENGTEDSILERMNLVRGWIAKITGYELDPLKQQESIKDFLTHEVPESVRNAYKGLVELGIDESLLTHYYFYTNPDVFSYSEDSTNSIAGWVGKYERRNEPVIPNLPPTIFIDPELSWLRKIIFSAMRNHYFPLFNSPSNGLHKVREALAKDSREADVLERQRLSEASTQEEKRAVREEYALKRQFLSALERYFMDIDSLPHPSRLKNSLGGKDPFPNRYQQVPILETALLGRFFNAGQQASGKTGATIATFESLREQRDEHNRPLAKRALILCPSGIVRVWKERLSDGDTGYFRKGTLPKGSVVVIDGPPAKRRWQWEAAKRADYVVIGIEMSREETDTIEHEEWLKELGADFLVIDEVHNVKNPYRKKNGKTDTTRIYEISQEESIRYRVLLSGTPIPNHRKDIAAQLRLLHAEPERTGRKREQNLHNAFDAYIAGVPLSARDRKTLSSMKLEKQKGHSSIGSINFHNIDHLIKMVENCDVPITQHYLLPYFYRPGVQESLPVGTLLHPVQEDLTALSTNEQARYDHAAQRENEQLLQKIHSLHRVCLQTDEKNDNPKETNTKFARLCHWIDEFLKEKDHSGKVIVASPHYKQGVTEEEEGTILQNLRIEYERKGVKIFRLDGDVSSHAPLREKDTDGSPMTKTKKVIAAFRDHKGPAVLLSQMKVISEGIDLSFASRAILLSPAWTRAEEDQFWRRLYRRGQLHDVKRVKLITKGTIEEGIHWLSGQKEIIGEKMLNGRKLTEEQLQLIEAGRAGIRANPYMRWLMLPPKEKLQMLWGQLAGRGEKVIRNSMEHLGPILAELYNLDWETSYNGNTARVVGGILRNLYGDDIGVRMGGSSRSRRKVADIASGAFALARTLDMDVSSFDINPHMIGPEMGRLVLGRHYYPSRHHVCAMDHLHPVSDGSMDDAVLSLALHYTLHKEKEGEAGRERMRTIEELNRILVPGGHAILTLPHSIFQGRRKQKFDELASALRYGGFEILPNVSGRVKPAKKELEQKKFELYVFTLEKVSNPLFCSTAPWKDIPKEVRGGLDFSRVRRSGGEGGIRKPPVYRPAEEGTYYNEFVLEGERGDTPIQFSMPDTQKEKS